MLRSQRHALKEIASAVPVVQKTLGLGKVLLARKALSKGDWYSFASHLLFCSKHIDDPAGIPGYSGLFQTLVAKARKAATSPIEENPFLASFRNHPSYRQIRKRLEHEGLANKVRLRLSRADDSCHRQGDLMILKEPVSRDESGVMCVKYNMGIASLPAFFDMRKICRDYSLLLEPSTWGYQDPIFLLYLGKDVECIVQSQNQVDFDYIDSLATNLVPVTLGAGDWVDPQLFREESRQAKEYDLVMVAGWDPLKRHREFFRCIKRYNRDFGKKLRMVFIGYPMSRDLGTIVGQAERLGIRDQCEFFEKIPSEEVAGLVRRSKVGVLWSKREGANKALYETIFSDVPVIVYDKHRGVNLRHIVEEVGRVSNDDKLHLDLNAVLENLDELHPRKWALANTGWENSNQRVNSMLMDRAGKEARNWTINIAPKKNAPNLLYARAEDAERFADAYGNLEPYLSPDARSHTALSKPDERGP